MSAQNTSPIVTRKTFLYNEGNECTSITGGWNFSFLVCASSAKSATQKYSDHMFLQTLGDSGSAWCRTGVGTANKISITGYKRICIEYTCTLRGSTNRAAVLALSGRNTVPDTSGNINSSNFISTNERAVATINLDNRSGSYYVLPWVCGYGNSLAHDLTIYKIWLEEDIINPTWGTGNTNALKGVLPVNPPQPSISRLPSGYQELEYIKSTGTQYIDTGVKPNNSNNTGIKIEYLSDSADTYPWIFGAENSDNTNRYGVWQSSSTLAPRYGAYSQNLSSTRGTNRHTVEFYNGSFFYDNALIGTGGTVYTINYNIFLSTMNQAGSPISDGSNGKCKLYNCEITENSIQIRNFIPCERLSDNAIGMYDLVSNTFFGNAGTGTFIAGAPVINPIWGNSLANVARQAIQMREKTLHSYPIQIFEWKAGQPVPSTLTYDLASYGGGAYSVSSSGIYLRSGNGTSTSDTTNHSHLYLDASIIPENFKTMTVEIGYSNWVNMNRLNENADRFGAVPSTGAKYMCGSAGGNYIFTINNVGQVRSGWDQWGISGYLKTTYNKEKNTILYDNGKYSNYLASGISFTRANQFVLLTLTGAAHNRTTSMYINKIKISMTY